jgi:hypothetical protein
MGPSLIAPSSITPVHQLDFADLWLYIPPWPVCGNAPTQGMPHTLTVSTEVSSVKVGSTFTPGDGSNPLNLPFGGAAPTFNYFSGNASNIVALTTNIHATAADVLPMVNNELNRMQMTVPWTTNMLPSYATSNNVQNDLRVLVGKFAARSVVTVSVSDVGRCSNVGQDFTIVGTWGVHLTPANDPTVNHPEVFSFGTASEWDVQQNMYNWYFKANGTDLCEALPGIHALPLLFFPPLRVALWPIRYRPSCSAHAVSPSADYLWLYIPPLPACGQPGTAPSAHTCVITVQSSIAMDQTWVGNQRPTYNYPMGTVVGAPPFVSLDAHPLGLSWWCK